MNKDSNMDIKIDMSHFNVNDFKNIELDTSKLDEYNLTPYPKETQELINKEFEELMTKIQAVPAVQAAGKKRKSSKKNKKSKRKSKKNK